MDLEKLHERVILIAVQTDNGREASRSLDELEDLCRTAGAETVGRVIQNREAIHPGTYIGSGKIEEVKDLIFETEATGVVCDDELSPAQMKNLEDLLDIKIMDRTVVILDIFAGRASTSEGKIQVELAQLRYSLTRLAGYGTSMSRLGGGIGTRGPGETRIETDRRRIRSRITYLKKELEDVVRHREVTRQKRIANHIPVIALVGYTNAGKSTLLNRLTGSDVLSEDKLFATLDPTTRALILPNKERVLLTDTVGFIDKLPHHLVDAFRSTLEEAKYADVIAHIVDASNPERDTHMEVVYRTLSDLGIAEKPVLTVFNKCDLPDPWTIHRDPRAEKVIDISAIDGQGLDEFISFVQNFLTR
ncbi:MAG: GTPase HflX, partial [Lachnospiraceae bacterium]|nr:GTPase HflX [Lachnospiraceae bacterium]